MESNKGLYLDLVQRAEDMGSKNENLDIIERGNKEEKKKKWHDIHFFFVRPSPYFPRKHPI